jgi:hypothetical protein
MLGLPCYHMVSLVEKSDQRIWLDAAEGKICPGSSTAVQLCTTAAADSCTATASDKSIQDREPQQ